MFQNSSAYIGIDPTAGTRPFTYAAIDADRRLLALGQGSLDEVLAYVAGQRSALVAVCAPYRPNQGVMERPEVRAGLSPAPRPGRWTKFRLAEYQLRQHNIPAPQTPANSIACPSWMQMGFTLYRRLEGLDFKPYPDAEASHQWLEVYPHACFTVLLGRLPFPKHSLEGRLQRQLILHDLNLNIADPMLLFEEITRRKLLQGILPLDQLHPPEELDALAAAYTAWYAASRPAGLVYLGDPSEGQIVLPVTELKSRY
jgi:hypothetical protein